MRVEPIERANGGLILRIRLHDAPVTGDGVLDVLELHLENLSGAQTKLDEALGRVAELVELRVVELRDLRPPVHHHGQALEVAERLLVAVVEGSARA